jgi:peptide/nickel transport system substrate-binding protein
MAGYLCSKIPSPDTQWQGDNINRFCDPAYDAKLAELSAAADPAARQAIAKTLNDMVTKDTYTVIPLVHRGTLSAHSNTLGGVNINAWDTEIWNVQDWFRVK